MIRYTPQLTNGEVNAIMENMDVDEFTMFVQSLTEDELAFLHEFAKPGLWRKAVNLFKGKTFTPQSRVAAQARRVKRGGSIGDVKRRTEKRMTAAFARERARDFTPKPKAPKAKLIRGRGDELKHRAGVKARKVGQFIKGNKKKLGAAAAVGAGAFALHKLRQKKEREARR